MTDQIDYAQLVSAIGDAIIISDAKGAITLWNPAAERMFGFTQAEAMGQSLDLIIPERLRGRHWEGYDKTMRPASRATATTCSSARGRQGRQVHVDRLHRGAAQG